MKIFALGVSPVHRCATGAAAAIFVGCAALLLTALIGPSIVVDSDILQAAVIIGPPFVGPAIFQSAVNAATV